MRVLVFGRTGQVGRELARLDWPHAWDVVQLDRARCDLTDAGSIADAIGTLKPAVVVNAAAYTAVDRAESEPDLARRINRDAPSAMAHACSDQGAAFVHLSTDYVFDGRKADAYRETDAVNPLSIYGKTKEEGEASVRESLSRHVIVRTSWVFSAHGANFVKTMLRLGTARPELRIVADQHGCPTSARDIARALLGIVRGVERDAGTWGTFHFSGDEPTTWFGFAGAIFAQTNPRPVLTPITTAEYPTPAQRPFNSLMDCTRIREQMGVFQPSWREALQETLRELVIVEADQP